MDSLEDGKLIRRVQQGDREAYRLLVEKYYDDVFRYCFYKTGQEQPAYDCAQDTFLHLTKYIMMYTERGKFKAYLFSIARNACHDYFRRQQNGGGISFEQAEEYAQAMGSCDAALGNVELKDLLRQALNRLPMMQREVVVLHYLHDFKLREIAKMTGVSLPTAKSRLRQGMQKLRSILEADESCHCKMEVNDVES